MCGWSSSSVWVATAPMGILSRPRMTVRANNFENLFMKVSSFLSIPDCGTKLVPRKPQCQPQVRAIRKAKTFRGVPRLHREYALAIALKANVRLCLGGFSSDNHARIFPRKLIEVTNGHSARA